MYDDAFHFTLNFYSVF